MQECTVCFHDTTDIVLPCQHSLCPECANKWFPRKLTCPLCTQVALALQTPDPRFCVPKDTTNNVTITVFEPMGVTLKDHPQGVYVSSAKMCDLAYRNGVTTGKVITHINGIAMRNHANAVMMIERTRALRMPYTITLQAPKKKRKFPWSKNVA